MQIQLCYTNNISADDSKIVILHNSDFTRSTATTRMHNDTWQAQFLAGSCAGQLN